MIPIYNDWPALSGLLGDVQKLRLPRGLRLRVMLVDDGSTLPMPARLGLRPAKTNLSGLSVLRLVRNLGHQSAIAVGLGHLTHTSSDYDGVIIMDGDGEDAPEDILKLLAAWEAADRRRAIFAFRVRRSEGPVFRVFYTLYRWAYRLMTGTWISMGNFSILPRDYVNELLYYPELWRHYPATVKKSRLPMEGIPTERAKRIDGSSKMNFYNLVLHGLGAITVHSDIVGVRALVALGIFIGLCGLSGSALAGLAFAGILPQASWSPLWFTLLVALQFMSSAIIFSFLTLAGRSPVVLDPARNYQRFVKRVTRVF
jgi:glycosyltransferase involved in cell wall biosynthesis